MNLDLSPEALRLIITKMIILIASITVHEFGHAIVADKLGDGLPRSQGRVTLSPIAHADPFGTLVLPAIGLLFTGGQSIGFGWGRPVMTQPLAYTRRFSMRTGHMFVAAAGPAMNLLLGFFLSAVWVMALKFAPVFTFQHDVILSGVIMAAQLNFVLAFFNLIPTAPLDGGTVLRGLLPTRALPQYDEIMKYGYFVLFAIILLGSKPIPIGGSVFHLVDIFVWPAMKLMELWIRLLS